MTLADAARRLLALREAGQPGEPGGIDTRAQWAAFDDLEAALEEEECSTERA